jgi:hypothetical protein
LSDDKYRGRNVAEFERERKKGPSYGDYEKRKRKPSYGDLSKKGRRGKFAGIDWKRNPIFGKRPKDGDYRDCIPPPDCTEPGDPDVTPEPTAFAVWSLLIGLAGSTAFGHRRRGR